MATVKKGNKPTTRTKKGVKDPIGLTFAMGLMNTANSTTQPYGHNNVTVYKNEPVVGGQQEIILNDIYVRSPIRSQIGINNYLDALRAAEMRPWPNRTRLYDIYTHLSLDGHYTGVKNKRILSVINQQIYYQNPKGEEIDGMSEFLASNEFDILKRTIMETKEWGISGFEFLPGPLVNFRIIPRKHIKPKTQIISIEQNDQSEGYDYTKLDNVWVIGEPEDLGYFNQCCQYLIYKREAIADWANFIEIFGMPIRVIKYDPTDPDSEAKLTKMVDQDGNVTAILIPNTATVEIIDGKTANATGGLQDTFVKAMDQNVSIAVLGNTETTSNSGTGSQAKSKTHSDQQKELLKADLRYLEAHLNDPHFLKILQSYGLPVIDGGRFNIKSEIDISYAIQKIEIDTALSASGLDIALDYFYQTYDIPKPSPGDKTLKALAPANPKGEDGINLDDRDGAAIRMSLIEKMLDKKLKDFFA